MLTIKKQTYKNYEVCIIDGNSDDGTKEFLLTLIHPFYYISEKDKGIYDAMNKGIDLSKGEWLYFLGVDDKLYNNDVLNKVSKFFNEKKLDLIFGEIKYEVKGSSPFIYSKEKTEKKPKWDWTIWLRNPVHHQATFYRKELLLENKYDLRYKVLSDYAMNIFLYQKGVNYKIINYFIATCGASGVSKSGEWNIYKEEISLKTNIKRIWYPFFYLISACKFLMRVVQNARR